MAVPLAELFISVSADVNAAVTGLNQLNGSLNGTTNAFNQARPAALLFEAGAAAVAAGLFSSIKVAADFEHQMSGVKAVMSPGEVQQFSAALSDLALKLGRDTVFTSREAAAGIEELIKAGIPAQAVLSGAASAALSLAAATGIPVAQAATVAATAMNTFAIQAGDLSHVVDILAGTANASAADISQLQFGMQAVGPVAAQMGLSLEDTAAALGIFANNGLRGQDAGTSLKTMLLNLVPNTKKQTEEFKKLGLITAEGSNVFFDAEGHLRNLADISQILTDSLSGLTDEQRISTLQTLFGTDAVRAAAILYRTGGDAVNAFHTEVGKVSAEDAAKTRLDNLAGTLQNLGGSVETVQIVIGNLFLPTIRSLAEQARHVVDNFTNLSPETQRLAVFITAGGAAVLGLLGALILLGPLVIAMTASFGALGTIMSFALGPVGLIVIGIAALAAGLAFAFNNNEDFRNGVLAAWGVVQNQLVPAVLAAADALAVQLGPILEQINTSFQTLAADAGPKLADFFSNVLPGALVSLATQIGSLGPLLGSVLGFFGAINNLIGTIASTGLTAIQALFENVLGPGIVALGTSITPMQPVIEGMGNALTTLGTSLTTIGAFLQPVTDLFNDMAKAINDAATAIQTFPLPGFLTPGTGSVLGGTPGGPVLKQSAFNPNIPFGPGAGAGGPIVAIGQLIISTEAEADAFLKRMADAVRGSAGRVNAPPDNSGFPALVVS